MQQHTSMMRMMLSKERLIHGVMQCVKLPTSLLCDNFCLAWSAASRASSQASLNSYVYFSFFTERQKPSPDFRWSWCKICPHKETISCFSVKISQCSQSSTIYHCCQLSVDCRKLPVLSWKEKKHVPPSVLYCKFTSSLKH